MSTAFSIENQVMWNRILALVEEQSQTLIRTAFGAATREAGDVSAGVYDARGRMVAQAVTGTPGHVNSMAQSVGHLMDRVPVAEMEDGDVFIFNDPWIGTGHLNDIVVITPVRRRERLVGFFACTLHVVDIGGVGMSGVTRQVYEEGIFIPPCRIVEKGVINKTVIDIISNNVRESDQVMGDIYSEISANHVGSVRLQEMLDEFGLDDFEDLADYIIDTSREASLRALRDLPRDTYTSSMMIDGYEKPLDIHVSLTISDSGVDVAFFDTPDILNIGINVPLCYTEAYTSFGVKVILLPDVPNNAGSLEVTRVTAPPGSLLNALRPAPVSGRGGIGQLLPDVVMGCLAQFVPDRVPAEGTSCLWNVRMMGGAGRVYVDVAELANATPFNITSFHSGGTGGRPHADGMSATAFPSGVRNVPVEITESMAPLIVWRKDLRPDSGGPGRYRGGLGQIMEIASTENVAFSTISNFDRARLPARGRWGGKSGMTGRVSLKSGATLPSRGYAIIPAGDRLVVEMPGGGGLGEPGERDASSLAEDVACGYVTNTDQYSG